MNLLFHHSWKIQFHTLIIYVYRSWRYHWPMSLNLQYQLCSQYLIRFMLKLDSQFTMILQWFYNDVAVFLHSSLLLRTVVFSQYFRKRTPPPPLFFNWWEKRPTLLCVETQQRLTVHIYLYIVMSPMEFLQFHISCKIFS